MPILTTGYRNGPEACLIPIFQPITLCMDITVQELKERIDKGESPLMIDVRESFEWDQQHLPGVKMISLGSLPHQLDEIADLKDREIVVICRSGGRSGNAAAYLRQNGFQHVRNLTGGLLAWKAKIDPEFDIE